MKRKRKVSPKLYENKRGQKENEGVYALAQFRQ